MELIVITGKYIRSIPNTGKLYCIPLKSNNLPDDIILATQVLLSNLIAIGDDVYKVWIVKPNKRVFCGVQYLNIIVNKDFSCNYFV